MPDRRELREYLPPQSQREEIPARFRQSFAPAASERSILPSLRSTMRSTTPRVRRRYRQPRVQSCRTRCRRSNHRLRQLRTVCSLQRTRISGPLVSSSLKAPAVLSDRRRLEFTLVSARSCVAPPVISIFFGSRGYRPDMDRRRDTCGRESTSSILHDLILALRISREILLPSPASPVTLGARDAAKNRWPRNIPDCVLSDPPLSAVR